MNRFGYDTTVIDDLSELLQRIRFDGAPAPL